MLNSIFQNMDPMRGTASPAPASNIAPGETNGVPVDGQQQQLQALIELLFGKPSVEQSRLQDQIDLSRNNTERANTTIMPDSAIMPTTPPDPLKQDYDRLMQQQADAGMRQRMETNGWGPKAPAEKHEDLFGKTALPGMLIGGLLTALLAGKNKHKELPLFLNSYMQTLQANAQDKNAANRKQYEQQVADFNMKQANKKLQIDQLDSAIRTNLDERKFQENQRQFDVSSNFQVAQEANREARAQRTAQARAVMNEGNLLLKAAKEFGKSGDLVAMKQVYDKLGKTLGLDIDLDTKYQGQVMQAALADQMAKTEKRNQDIKESQERVKKYAAEVKKIGVDVNIGLLNERFARETFDERKRSIYLRNATEAARAAESIARKGYIQAGTAQRNLATEVAKAINGLGEEGAQYAAGLASRDPKVINQFMIRASDYIGVLNNAAKQYSAQGLVRGENEEYDAILNQLDDANEAYAWAFQRMQSTAGYGNAQPVGSAGAAVGSGVKKK